MGGEDLCFEVDGGGRFILPTGDVIGSENDGETIEPAVREGGDGGTGGE